MKLHEFIMQELDEPNSCRKSIFAHIWAKKAPNFSILYLFHFENFVIQFSSRQPESRIIVILDFSR